jgi:polygalacturonase
MVSVKDFGAIGDGSVLDTVSIQKAIDAAASGNDTEVYIPEGIYIVGTVFLRSNISFRLDKKALLLASSSALDWEKSDHTPLVYGDSVENVKLSGGTISCNALSFHDEKGERIGKYRPNGTLKFRNSKNITVSDITVKESVNWSVHFDNCEYVSVDRVVIRNPEYIKAKNTDGIDINSCRHVRVDDCDIETGDDAICLKSVDKADFSAKRPDMYDIRITNCVLASTCNCTKIGTETIGNIYDVVFDSITIRRHSGVTQEGVNRNPDKGGNASTAISIQSNDGASVYDITFKNYIVHEINTPVFILLQARTSYVPNTAAGEIFNITVDGLICEKSYRASQFNSCAGSFIKNVTLKNILINNYEVYSGSEPVIAPIGKLYPEPFKYGNMPAFGLFARNTINLKIDENIVFHDKEETGRPPVMEETLP